MSFTRRLSFRLAAPVVSLTVIVWAIFYFVVLDIMGRFDHDLALKDLKSTSREVFNTCDRSFNELAHSGGLNEPTAVHVAEALTLGDVEELLKEFKLDAVIWKTEGERRSTLLDTTRGAAVNWNAIRGAPPHTLISFRTGSGSFYAYGIEFQPWDWNILLLRNTTAYQRWSDKFRGFHVAIGGLALILALGMILFENWLLRRPVETIVRDLRKGAPPTYRGVEELEFLSDSIADMMRTLAERETQLRESEARYRTIFETTGTAIMIAEDDTTISLVNNEFLEYTGYSREEVEGRRSWTDIVAEADLDRMKAIHQLRQTSPDDAPRQYEFDLTDKYGGAKHILLTANIIPGTTQTIASLMDITDHRKRELELRLEQEAQAAEELRKKNVELGREIETRKRIEHSLRVSEERFRAIFETAEDCIFIKNVDHEYTHVNAACTRLLGRPAEEIIGSKDQALSLDPNYAARAESLEARVLQGEALETQHTLMWKGWPISLNIVRFPLKDASGATFGICGIARDVSDRAAKRDASLIESPHAYSSPAIQETIKWVNAAARSDSTVLFLGESGSGKDYWARYLHDSSSRSGGPFLGINCAALSPELVESELFGHAVGAFTGARAAKRGLLELAEGGTLLLNEIGEMPLPMQAKLLTFLDTQTITRVGGEKSVTVDTRILAATNRNIAEEVERGEFRQDLYYRLAVLTINIPPLRNRIEDLPVLASELLRSIGERMGLSLPVSLDSDVLSALTQYTWPGNIRELRNVLERIIILNRDGRIIPEDLGLEKVERDVGEPLIRQSFEAFISEGGAFHDAVDTTKRIMITRALERTNGNIKEAAELLEVTRNSIDHHIRRLGISKSGNLSTSSRSGKK